ncbi:hypothetical protein [Halobacteriovorax sp. HLS]|uniref:hypothetical protein n=1 Tax=Halobacteriovorax sp. HLS TaxID=2234000 RepID=UPI000FDBA1AB|nr:hypothetical protein [Halobacteriovorax sp. HLS]
MKYLLIILYLVIFNVFAGDWTQLYKTSGLGNKVVVSYDPLDKVIKLDYRKGMFARVYSKEFSVKNTVVIDEVTSEVKELLAENNIPEATIEEALEEVQNLKYLDGSSCHIVSFGITPEASNELAPLLSKISAEIVSKEAGVDSHFLINLKLKDDKPVELRAITNKEGEIIQFSLFSETEDLSSFRIENESPLYHVMSNNKHFFTLKVDKGSRDRISVLVPSSKRVQNVDRIHLKLQRTKKGISSTIYSSNKDKEIKQSQVLDLRNIQVEYVEVVNINNSDRYYKALEESEIESIFKFNEYSTDLLEKVKMNFARCMDEQYLLSIESQEEMQFRENCINEASIEGLLLFGESLKSENLIDNYSLGNIKQALFGCLINHGVMKKSRTMRTFIHPFKDKELVLNKCSKTFNDITYREVLSKEIERSHDVRALVGSSDLLQELKKIVLSEYVKCLDHKDASECKKDESKKLGRSTITLLMSKNLSDIEVDDLVNRLQLCEMNDANCLKKVYLGLSSTKNSDSSRELLKRIFPNKSIKLNAKEKELYNTRFSLCMSDLSLPELSEMEAFQKIKDREQECYIKSFKKSLAQVASIDLISKSPFSILNEKNSDSFRKKSQRAINEKLKGVILISDIKEIIDDSADSLMPQFVDTYLESRFNELIINGTSKQEVLSNLTLMLNGDSSKTVQENIRSIVNLQKKKREDFDTTLFILDTLKNVEISMFEAKHEQSESFIYRKCINTESKDRMKSLNDLILKCRKEVFSQQFFLEKKKLLEQEVSTHMSLLSKDANDALSVVVSFERCLHIQNVNEDNLQSLKRKSESCFLISKLDILNNLSESKIVSNAKIIGGNSSSDGLKLTKDCYANYFLHLLRDSKNTISSEDRSELKELIFGDSSNQSLSELIKQGHMNTGRGSVLDHLFDDKNRERIINLISRVSELETFSDSHLTEYSKSCNKVIDQKLFHGFQDFILENISASFDLSVNEFGETNREILKKVLDQELLDQLLLFKKKTENSFALPGNSDPRSQIVTAQLSVDSLAMLIKLIGESISKGFVFDKNLMKTELVVFKSELKRALKWLNTTERNISLDELQGFFKSTKLADLLAYATVSEQVYNRFEEFISEQEISEKRVLNKKFKYKSYSKLDSSQKKEWNRMVSKFSAMRKEAKEITSSYDFRRLFRDGSESSKLKLAKIKSNYLLPLVTKGSVSENAKQEVVQIVADLILKDNANGGFIEKFVGTTASEFLQNKEDGHWAITKWLFYDEGDFEWSKLKSTKSGAKAMDYYGKYILLPEVLKQRVSAYTKSIRLSKFKKLLVQAQSEND